MSNTIFALLGIGSFSIPHDFFVHLRSFIHFLDDFGSEYIASIWSYFDLRVPFTFAQDTP